MAEFEAGDLARRSACFDTYSASTEGLDHARVPLVSQHIPPLFASPPGPPSHVPVVLRERMRRLATRLDVPYASVANADSSFEPVAGRGWGVTATRSARTSGGQSHIGSAS